MSSTSRRETTTSALLRLRADAEAVARTLTAGRAALPALAMGSDPEGVVHAGVDAGGEIVRLDLDPSWRDVVPLEGFGAAVTDALRHAAEVRTGDWAAALSVPDGGPHAAPGPAPRPVAGEATSPAAPVILRDGGGPALSIAASWLAGADDTAVRDTVLAAVAAPRAAAVEIDGAGLPEVRELARRTHIALTATASALPPFMLHPVQASIDRVHDDAAQALDLSLAGRAVARPVLREYASGLDECLRLVHRPAGLPEASQAWAAAAVGLTAGLARAEAPGTPMLARLGRWLGAAG